MQNFLMRANILLLTFLFSFAVTACATNLEFNQRKVDPPLQEYVRDYVNLAKYHCPKIRIPVYYSITLNKKLEKDTWVGVCRPKLNGFSIEILESFWASSNPNERRQLIYHEMAHCVIDRDHEELDEHHYMFPVVTYVSYEDYIKQSIEDIEAYCKTL